MDDSPPRSSPADEEISSYGTPDGRRDSSAKAENIFGGDNDANLVIGAGRTLKTMLGDLTSVLEDQAKAPVFLTGEMHLRISGREEYTLSLVMEDAHDPGSLKVKIEKKSGGVNGLKRKADLTSANNTTLKKSRTDFESSSSPKELMDKLEQLSQQIHWVETCRRIADEAHDKCEDTWRTTSATFHHDASKLRERHEAWIVQEMSWQRNMLISLSNDVKGLYPLGHSLKWETPRRVPAPLPVSEGEYPRYVGRAGESPAMQGQEGGKMGGQMGGSLTEKKKT